MRTRDLIAAIFAAATWLLLLMNLAFYWRFGAPAAWLVRAFNHGTLEQVGLLAWLVVLLLLIHEGD